jgi:O-antigen biosynthesis alpha-1,3-abequosyltransferase
MKIPVSFCIPTRNRANFIADCLDRIIPQLSEFDEIIVLDGASTDDTEKILARYVADDCRIRYFRNADFHGIDRDLVQAVYLARNPWCWLMSDDDWITSGAVDVVRRYIASSPCIAGASVNSLAYDRTMTYPIRTVPAVSGNRASSNILFRNDRECFAALGLHFGFLSAQIVNRALWCEVINRGNWDDYCNCWLLIYVIGRMLQDGHPWLYIHQPLIHYRSGNDSFQSTLGTLRRQEITHLAFEKIVADLWGDGGLVYKSVMRTLIRDRMGRSLAVMKADGCPLSLQAQLINIYIRQYWKYPSFWIHVAPLFFVPSVVFRMLRKAYFYYRLTLAKKRMGMKAAIRMSPANDDYRP